MRGGGGVGGVGGGASYISIVFSADDPLYGIAHHLLNAINRAAATTDASIATGTSSLTEIYAAAKALAPVVVSVNTTLSLCVPGAAIFILNL